MKDLYKYIYLALNKIGLLNFLSDRLFLKLQYRAFMGEKLNLNNPVSYNEKLNWLKLYNRVDLYTVLVDKLAVKEWVNKRLSTTDYTIPTLAVYNSIDEIVIEDLPESFVLKTTHSGDSLGVSICKRKETYNFQEEKKKLLKSLRTDYYKQGREWPYKNVKRQIIAEEYLEDEYGELRDYKFFCFDGVVKALFVATDRSTGNVCFDYFDADFNHLDFVQSHPMSGKHIDKPKNFDKMIEIASTLSQGIPHVRVDLYNVNGRIYFGEMTFYHYGGIIEFHPHKWDMVFGDWIDLSGLKKS